MQPARADLREVWQVFIIFLKLGLTSFGGPVAHLGYFRSEFVERRRWLDDRSYSDLVALCQFLPGPASSQVGMAVGLGRAGWLGMLAAWTGFTLPSAVVLIAFALGIAYFPDIAESGWVQGLKVVAVAIVAQAVWGMARTLCPDRARAALAVGSALLTLVLPSTLGQVTTLVVGGVLGRFVLSLPESTAAPVGVYPITRRGGTLAFLLFVAPLIGLPLWMAATGSSVATLIEGVYRSGALVFGGGHVVLPLLQASLVPSGLLSNADFVAGYGAAQAVPGPLFTFAAYIGAVAHGPLQGWLGGLVTLVVIFVPAALVLLAALPFWEALRQRPDIQSVMAGVNAAVVGILLSALYDPVWTSAILGHAEFGLALAAFGLLVIGRLPPVSVVLLSAIGGALLLG